MQRCLPQDPHWNLHQEAGYVSCQKRWLWPWAPGIVQGGPHQQHPSSHTSWHSWAAGCSPVKMIYGTKSFGDVETAGKLRPGPNLVFSRNCSTTPGQGLYKSKKLCCNQHRKDVHPCIYIYIHTHYIYIYTYGVISSRNRLINSIFVYGQSSTHPC